METNTLPGIVQSRVSDIMTLVDGLMELKVTNQATSTKAGFALKTLKGGRRDLEDLRKQLTKPLDDEKKAVMGAFAPRIEIFDKAISHLDSELKCWLQRERERQEAERKKAEEEAKAQQLAEQERLTEAAKQAEEAWDFQKAEELKEKSETVRVPVAIIPEKRPLIRGLQERKKYGFKVVDVNAIPREFLIPDEKALGELARSTKGQAVVPGIEFFEEAIIAG